MEQSIETYRLPVEISLQTWQQITDLQTMDCFCTAHKLRMVFTFLKCCKNKDCGRDSLWPAEPKIFTIWYFTESLLTVGSRSQKCIGLKETFKIIESVNILI